MMRIFNVLKVGLIKMQHCTFVPQGLLSFPFSGVEAAIKGIPISTSHFSLI